MADVLPFRGLRYNQSKIKDLSRVICPPYDIISPAHHEELHTRSEFNFIRIEDARSTVADTKTDNKYTHAANTLKQWMESRVLVRERKPAIYLHDHFFRHAGKEMRRRGVIARVRLEEWEKGVVRPHEGILGPARDDRLNILWALQVNTSPVLAMYQDNDGTLASLLAAYEDSPPVINALMPEGERHQVRSVSDAKGLKSIGAHLADVPLYIADGHHRYTSALTYRREKMACTPGATPDDPFNFVMITLVAFDDPGLIILAPHRLIRGIEKSVIESLESRLTEFFDIRKLPLRTGDPWREIDRAMARTDTVSFSCLITSADHLCVLTLKPHAIDGETMPLFHTKLYRTLDVSVIDHIILEKILGLGIGGADEAKISYFYDRQEGIERVQKGEYQIAFFLKPVKPELIKAVADAGDKMPRKSTYFYPKAPAGLVVNELY